MALTEIQRRFLGHIHTEYLEGIKYMINKYKIDPNFGVIDLRVEFIDRRGRTILRLTNPTDSSRVLLITTNPLAICINRQSVPVNIKLIELLLDGGADINYCGVNLISPLIIAIDFIIFKHERRSEYVDLLQLFIDAGRPNLNAMHPRTGRTILENAELGTVYPPVVNKMILDHARRRNSLVKLFDIHHNVGRQRIPYELNNAGGAGAGAGGAGAGAGGTGGRRRRRFARKHSCKHSRKHSRKNF